MFIDWHSMSYAASVRWEADSKTTVEKQFRMDDILLTTTVGHAIIRPYPGPEVHAMYCKLSTLMGMSRYTIQDVHEKTGLSRSTISLLYHDRATRIDYDTVEKLCGLFHCQISDLLSVGSKPSNMK